MHVDASVDSAPLLRLQWLRLHLLGFLATLIFSVGVPLSRLIVHRDNADYAGRGRDPVYHCD
jgi:hypothetical protein